MLVVNRKMLSVDREWSVSSLVQPRWRLEGKVTIK